MFSYKIETCMQVYWRKLWAADLLEKCKSFLPVGKWLQRRGKEEHVGAPTTHQNQLNIACGPTHTQI